MSRFVASCNLLFLVLARFLQIVGADKDDEALEKYKRDLLGDVSTVAIVDDADPRSVGKRNFVVS